MWTAADGSELYNNIGLAMGAGYLAIDVDVKGGKPGRASLKALEERGLNTHTLTCMTPSGGMHLFYLTPPNMVMRNGVNLLGDGIDVRGYRGYVVGAGSSLTPSDGRKRDYYLLHRTTPILEAPEWLLDAIGEGKPRMATALPLVELDLAENIERARDYLIERAPEAIQGVDGEPNTYLVAAHCIDYGLSEAETLTAMLTWWNDEKAVPPWSPAELQRKVENAWKYRKLPVGIKAYIDPRDEFGPIDVKGQIAPQSGAILTPKSRLFWRGYDESADRALLASQDPLVKRLLTVGAMSVLYGDSNTGKTFVALSLAHHVATGTPWHNRRVVGGPVVYVAAEAGESINARLAALRSHYAPSPPPPLAVVPCLVDLFAAGAALKPLIAMIKEIGTHYGAPVRFVVIDTLARAMAGGDENSTKDMGTFVGNVDRIRVETGAHVMIVHHTGKDQSRGARGSSALRAATDTELSLAKDSESREGLLTVAKQRDGETGLKIGFALSVVNLGVDTDGDPVTSCVALFADAQQEFGAVVSPAPQAWLEHLRAWEAEADGAVEAGLIEGPARGVTAAKLRVWATKKGLVEGISPQTVSDHLTTLTKAGLVEKGKQHQYFAK